MLAPINMLLVFLLLQWSWPVFAKEVSPNLCNPFYENVRKIYVRFYGDLPENVRIDWVTLGKRVTRLQAGDLERYGIALLQTEKSVEEILTEDSSALYVEIVSSYVSRSAFSIPPDADYIAAWARVHRNVSGTTKSHQSDSFPIRFVKTMPNPAALSSSIQAATPEPFQWVFCLVMHHTAQMQCTDARNPSENKLEALNEAGECLRVPDDVDTFEEIIEHMDSDQGRGEVK